MAWLRALLRPRDVDHDMQREIAAHVAMEQEHLVRAGLSPDEARRQALIAFGGLERHKEAVRDERGTRLFSDLSSDLRYAVRRLRRTPLVAAVITGTLAVVIGANTAIFGLANAIYLRQLPLPRPTELVAVRPMSGGNRVDVMYPAFNILRRVPDLPPMAAYFFEPLRVGPPQGDALVWGDVVTGDYFGLLGVRPLLGRLISASDEAAGAPVIVASAAFWRSQLGADSSVVGKSIRVNGQSFTLIGVTMPSFVGLYLAHEFEVAVPMTAPGVIMVSSLTDHYLDIISRLDRGISPVRAAYRLQAAFLGCCQHAVVGGQSSPASGERITTPDDGPSGDTQIETSDRRWHVELADASRGLTWSTNYRTAYRPAVIAIVAGVLILTLIACANVATLLLARATARSDELALRASLGANRPRLVRQLLTESVILASIGALLGIIVARVATTQLVAHLPPSISPLHDTLTWRPDPVILVFTAAVTVACTLLFGLWPARRATRPDLLTGIHGSRPKGPAMRTWGADRALVVSQLALALMLIAPAGLFVATLRNLGTVGQSHGTGHVIFAQISADGTPQEARGLGAIHDDLVRGILSIPGVTAASISEAVPIFPTGSSWWKMRLPASGERAGDLPDVHVDFVDAGFFAATAVRVIQGRAISNSDAKGSEPVAVVSASFAHHYFGQENAIGQSVTFLSDTAHRVRIVGIAGEANYGDLREPPVETLYRPLAQATSTSPALALAVRVTGDPRSMSALVRQRIDAIAPGLEVRRMTSLEDFVDGALASERVLASLASLFGVVALVLSAIGLYGLLAYQTTRRTREIGLRMALGAAPADAVWLVVGQTLGMATLAIACGIPLAVGITRAVRSQLFGIDSADPRVLMTSAALLLVVAFVAALLPARRAAHVDPVIALRSE